VQGSDSESKRLDFIRFHFPSTKYKCDISATQSNGMCSLVCDEVKVPILTSSN